jgi:hypothetical protein
VLAAIVLAAAVLGSLAIAKARNWAVMTDELLYTGMGRSIAHTILPLPQVRGDAVGYRQILFPTLIAPLVGALRMPAAYHWIAELNALLWASAAIPAYLVTRHVTSGRAGARWVAACTVATPWLAFGSKAIPDVTAFVIVLWVVWAMVRSVAAGPDERPLRGDLLTLAVIVLAYLARTQFLLLAGVWLGAVVLARAAAAARENGRRGVGPELLRLPRTRPLPLGLFLLVVLLYAFGRDLLLADYGAAVASATSAAQPGGLPRALLNHASIIALGVTGLPLVLGLPWLVTALTRLGDRRQFDTAVVIALLTLTVVWVAASFDLRHGESDRVIERYVFYVAPLVFVAMAAFFSNPPGNLAAIAVPAVLAILLLGVTQPFGSDSLLSLAINGPFSPVQVALVTYQRVANALGTSIFGLLSLVLMLLAIAVVVLVERDHAVLARDGSFALVLVVLLGSSAYAVPKIVETQNFMVDALFGRRTADQKAWVAQATGGAPASLAYSQRTDVLSHERFKQAERASNWWDLAFWNPNIAAVYAPVSAAQPPSIFPGRTHPMLPDWRTGRLVRADGDRSAQLVQAAGDPNYAPQYTGRPVRRGAYVVYRTGSDATAAWATRGLTLRGWIPPQGATLRVWAPRGASGPSLMHVRLELATTATPPSFAGFTIGGARAVVERRSGHRASYDWPATVPAGGWRDFRLERGTGPVHVERITVGQ